MTRTEELEAAVKLGKALKKLSKDEAKAMAESTERVKRRFVEKRQKLIGSASDEVRKLAGVE